MKNKSTLVSLVFATGSVVALVMILGNLESPSPSPSPSTTYKSVSPAGPVNAVVASAAQAEVVSQGISYEYDIEDDDEDDEDDNKHDNKDDNKHNGKSKRYGNNQLLPSAATPSTSNSTTTTTPSTPSISDSTQIQQNPKQSTTQAS